MSQLKKKKVMFDSLFDPEVHDSLLARQAHEIKYRYDHFRMKMLGKRSKNVKTKHSPQTTLGHGYRKVGGREVEA